jgi:hypothetical protein
MLIYSNFPYFEAVPISLLEKLDGGTPTLKSNVDLDLDIEHIYSITS